MQIHLCPTAYLTFVCTACIKLLMWKVPCLAHIVADGVAKSAHACTHTHNNNNKRGMMHMIIVATTNAK